MLYDLVISLIAGDALIQRMQCHALIQRNVTLSSTQILYRPAEPGTKPFQLLQVMHRRYRGAHRHDFVAWMGAAVSSGPHRVDGEFRYGLVEGFIGVRPAKKDASEELQLAVVYPLVPVLSASSKKSSTMRQEMLGGATFLYQIDAKPVVLTAASIFRMERCHFANVDAASGKAKAQPFVWRVAHPLFMGQT